LRSSVPRLLVAGLRGGSGKTLLSLGLAASFRSRGHTVAPFKKGPDYIDASWLARAAGRPCRNLDLFLFPPPVALRSFARGASEAGLAIIEGNRGLFDGMDAEGTFSSAELAKLLKAPVLLSVDVTKTTRTAAAMVLGCQVMDPGLSLAGVVLNRVAGSRHESVLRQAIEGICGVPVLGAIPKLPEDLFPERHLGLVPPQETPGAGSPLARIAEVAEEYLDLDGIFAEARKAGSLEIASSQQTPSSPKIASSTEIASRNGDGEPAGASAREGASRHQEGKAVPGGGSRPRVGVFVDAAFQFYYPENLESLEEAGGEIVEISPLQDEILPTVDALYLGGGFPETLAPGLSSNGSFLASVRKAADGGLPIYAECGGAVYLGRRLHYEGEVFGMVGALPVEYGFQDRPRGHGYTILEVVRENPFYPVGETIRGHEFHYTFMRPQESGEIGDADFAFGLHRGYGFNGRHDGLVRGNVLATYTHVHALGMPAWAPSLVRAAARFAGSLRGSADDSKG
jgi:cobyrinic acid a,c-diamide synthase